MKVTTMNANGSGQPQQTVSTNTLYPTPTAKDARERAIQKLIGDQPAQVQNSPVQSQQQVQPEEVGAIRHATNSQGQTPTYEGTQSSQATDIAAAVTATNSQTPETTQDSPNEANQLSSRLAQLAKREKALRIKAQQQEQTLKSREQALIDRENALQGRQSTFNESEYIPKARLKEDLVGVLNENGLTYDEVTQQYVNSQGRNPHYENVIKQMQAKIDKLEQGTDEIRQTHQKSQDEAYSGAIKQIKRDVEKLVFTDERFELTKNAGETDQVVQLIEQTYKEDGYLMTTEEAAEAIEAELDERMTKVIEKTKKIKNRFQTPVAPKPETQAQTPAPTQQTQPMKTLTNSNTGSRQLSARERALLAFEGKLKS